MNVTMLSQPQPVEVPDYAKVSPQTFVDWMMYQAPWREVMPMFLACPLCGSTVFGDMAEVMKHSIFHTGTVTV